MVVIYIYVKHKLLNSIQDYSLLVEHTFDRFMDFDTTQILILIVYLSTMGIIYNIYF